MNHNYRVGRFGEDLAAQYLQRKGYKILALNSRIGHKEIDIVASKEGKIILAEVKTRTSDILGRADDAFTTQKMDYLKQAAEIYLENKQISENLISIDLISVDIDKSKKIAKIRHYKDIF